jgi:hypothetical protein
VGEESFTDDNGTGFYQTGDPFANLGEPFLSANESGVYVLGDYFLNYLQKPAYQGPPSPPAFVGITCTGTSPSSTCTTNELAIGVSHLLIMSTGDANVSLYAAGTQGFVISGDTLSITAGDSGTVAFNIQDLNGNSMAAGTTVTAAFSSSSTGTFALPYTGGTFTFGCNSDIGGVDIGGTFTALAVGQGILTITVTSPSGSTTTFGVTINVTP